MSLDSTLENLFPNEPVLVLGNGNEAQTNKCTVVPYTNTFLLGNQKGHILNTRGFNTTNFTDSDKQLLTELYKIVLENKLKGTETIRSFFFVQSLTSEPVASIERVMKYLQCLFGSDIF